MHASEPQQPSRFRQFIILLITGLAALWFVGSSLWHGQELQAQSEETTPSPAAAEATAVATPLPGVPVEVGGKIIFYVRERLGGASPALRAQMIEESINRLATDPFAPPLELQAVESIEGIDIMNGDDIILTITERDAESAELSQDLEVLGGLAVKILEDEIMRTRALNTPRARVLRGLEALGFLVVFIIIIFLINRVYHRLVKRIDTSPTEDIEAKYVWQSSHYYRSGTWKRLAKLVLNIFRFLILLIILIYILPLILRIFPATASLAVELLALVVSPLLLFWEWLVAYKSNFFTIVIIIVATYLLIRFVRSIFREIQEGHIRFSGFDPEWAPFTSRLIAFLLFLLAVIVAFPYIPGSDSEAFKGISVFLGLLFTLSSTAAVTNIVAGIIQTYTGAFRVGDVVKIGDVSGIVTEKRLLTTRIRTFKNEEVSIPNGTVLNNNVLNYSTLAQDKGVVLYTTITIGYDVPWQQVQDLMVEAALATPDVLPDPRPFVLQTSLNDYNVAYQLNCFTKAPERMARIYSVLHQNIQDKFNEAGVEILSPAFSALRDGNTVTIPPDYLPKTYEAPAFRVTDVPGHPGANPPSD